MSLPANLVADELRARMPGVGRKKLHKLLYLCQGHHLAMCAVALFSDKIAAWDHGPVVGSVWAAERYDAPPPPEGAKPRLTEEQLNTIGYVISRYGRMSGYDLEILTHHQAPYLRADEQRISGSAVTIEQNWMAEFFRAESVDEDDDAPALDGIALKAWLQEVSAQPTLRGRVDDRARIQTRMQQLRASTAEA